MYGLLIRSQNRWIVDTKKPIKAVEKLVVLKKKKKKRKLKGVRNGRKICKYSHLSYSQMPSAETLPPVLFLALSFAIAPIPPPNHLCYGLKF